MPAMESPSTGRLPSSTSGELSDINHFKAEFASISTSLSNLFDGLSVKAAEAGEKEGQLQRELALWRDSYMRTEKKNSELEVQISDLRRQASFHTAAGSEFAVVIIDGDGLIFSAALLSQGTEGGRLAAQSLRERVRQALGAAQSSNAEIIVNVYMNKQGLGGILVKNGKTSWPTFEKFIEGFVTGHELNSIIDCGRGKEASDAKVRANLRLYADIAACKLILLGASHDNGYSSILHSLTAENKLDKILILKGYNVLAQELKAFETRVVDIPGLFMSEKLPTFHLGMLNISNPKPTSSIVRDSQPSPDKEMAPDDVVLYATAAQIARSSSRPVSSEPTESGQSRINMASKLREGSISSGNSSDSQPARDRKTKKKRIPGSVSKLKPRPCHGYYLLGRHCDPSCEWGHDYDLSPEQMQELRAFVKRMPCPFWLKDKCSHPTTCIYGHECQLGDNCPFGQSCRFLKWHKDQGHL
ncbi:hypothetical protein CALVIDRAFT_536830 [Calocera viscosa TUFC12733]|uniref:C3H1-type domain-containing protein n=1 Tax=Calocera viscosa (strain TUFC12733) TaxID=1330018 RepID=A0A167MNP7_CALVF|nr:hypothetical protein CALVIDRAFT_536830 [Calocera viscosa TUFC12733]